MSPQSFILWTENTIDFLSENSSVIFHVLITIHNLYQLISSHNQRTTDEDEDADGDAVQSVSIEAFTATRITTAATVAGSGVEDENRDEESSTGNESMMYISITSYDDFTSSSSSSGYSSASAVSPAIIMLNGSLSDNDDDHTGGDAKRVVVVQDAAERTTTTVAKRDTVYCENENGRHAITIPCHNYNPTLASLSLSMLCASAIAHQEQDFR